MRRNIAAKQTERQNVKENIAVWTYYNLDEAEELSYATTCFAEDVVRLIIG